MCSELPALNYFGSDTFYSSTLHVLTAIEIPIHIFGAYIIITKTPSKMQSVKRGLLFLHFAGAILDVYYSLIAAPVLTLPICAGYPLGISLLLGIPTSVQVYLGISFVGVIGVTIMLFFEDRYHRLVNGHRNDGEWCWWRILYLVIHYVLSVTYIAPGFFNIVDQDFAKSFVKIVSFEDQVCVKFVRAWTKSCGAWTKSCGALAMSSLAWNKFCDAWTKSYGIWNKF